MLLRGWAGFQVCPVRCRQRSVRTQGSQNGLPGTRSARRKRECGNEQVKGRSTFRIDVRLADFSRSWAAG